MSKIDPQVHDLADVVQYQVLAAQEGDDERFEQFSRKWDELAHAITARLRTPGTVEVSTVALAHLLTIYELAQGSLFADGEIAPGGELYDRLVHAVDDERNVEWMNSVRAALAKEDKSIPLHPAIAFPVHGLDQSNAKQVDAINAAAEALYQTLSKEDTNG